MTDRITVLAAILIAGCSTTAPPSATAAAAAVVENLTGPGPYAFDCDAGAGKTDSRSVPIPSGNLRITGLLQFQSARQDIIYEAAAGVEVIDPAKRSAAALQLLVRSDQQNKVLVAFGTASARPTTGNGFASVAAASESIGWATLGGTGASSNNVFASMPFTSEPIPFSLTVERSGTVNGSFGGVASPQPLSFSGATHLAIGCSTSHVHFSNVTIQSAG
ncbi:MAG: hypothetical protein ACREUT_18300 [Steroidobacteraceae bacterium]